MKNLLINTVILTILLYGTALATDGNTKEFEYTLDETYQIAANGTLSLNTEDADVKIVGSNRKDVHVNVYRKVTLKGIFRNHEDQFKIVVTEKDGHLVIREESERRISITIGSYSETYKIVIEVPFSVSLKLRGDDDNYIIKRIHGKINIDGDDGDVEISHCKSKKITIDLEDGDVEIADGIGNLTVDLDDGDLTTVNSKFSNVDITVSDGYLDIETSLYNKGMYQFRTDDGDLKLNITNGGGVFEVRHDDGRVRTSSVFKESYSGERKHKYNLPNGQAQVFIKTNDGNVRLTTD